MNRLFAFIIATAVCFGMAAPSQAMMKGMMGMGMRDMADDMEIGMHGPRMMDKIMSLDLNEKQKEAIRQTHFKWQKEFLKKKSEIEIARIDLKEILSADSVDMKAAEQKIRQIETLKADLKIAHLRTHEEFKSKLTPEQRKKLYSLMTDTDHVMPGCMGMGMKEPGMKMDCMMMHNTDEDSPQKIEPMEKPVPAPPTHHSH